MSLEHRALPAGGAVDFDATWLSASEAAAHHAALVRELAWEQRAIVLFGKEVLQPRLVAWAGELPYRYSGRTLEPRAATPTLEALSAAVVEATRVGFNHVLVNRYRDGNDSMGMHSDDEPELGPDPVVATLSLGTTRTFVLAPLRKGHPKESYRLSAGSLLVMRGACQTCYRHGVPRERAVTDERLSLTFRRVLRPPG